MTGVLYTTSGHDRCFALARMTGGARLEDSWARGSVPLLRCGRGFPEGGCFVECFGGVGWSRAGKEPSEGWEDDGLTSAD